MPRPSAASSSYQRYFDAKSLKSVASCAGIVFVIVHLVDYLGDYSISLKVLNIITLFLCMIITFLFVVNELVRLEEKIILGVANAALLFFSVIGFDSTLASSVFRKSPKPTVGVSPQPAQGKPATFHNKDGIHYAAFGLPFKIRGLMPSAQQDNIIQFLKDEKLSLVQENIRLADSVVLLKGLITTGRDTSYLAGVLSLERQIDSLKKQNRLLKAGLEEAAKNNEFRKSREESEQKPVNGEAGFMDKGNYISSYREMKQAFDAKLKACQQEANEYRTKYNLLKHGAERMMEKVRPVE